MTTWRSEKRSASLVEASRKGKDSEVKVPGRGTKEEEVGVTVKEGKAKERRPKDERVDPKVEKRAKALSKATVTTAATMDTVQRTVQSRDTNRVSNMCLIIITHTIH